MLTRRSFLYNSALLSAYLALPIYLGTSSSRSTVQASQALARPTTWQIVSEAADAPIVHLLNRITYGPRPGEVSRVAEVGYDAFLEQQLHPEQIDDSLTEQQLTTFPTLTMSSAELFAAYPQRGEPGPGLVMKELEAAALLRAIASERQLLEIMVDFWSNHFNIYPRKTFIRWLKTADDRAVIRRHALGKFRDLLLASAQSPAMLTYLDNIENVVLSQEPTQPMRGINENYARELMELHTIGVDGGYTQADVTTVARCLTGWGMNRPTEDEQALEFRFRARWHDVEPKQIPFLQLTFPAGGGKAEGEELLAALAIHPKTATRIAYKLAVTFVADEPPPALVARAAQTYLATDTDIRATLATILHADEFKAASGQKIKLPLRFLVSMVRASGSRVEDPKVLLPALTLLGQPFFSWPAPNGYPQTGAAWINTGALLARWNQAFALAEGRLAGLLTDFSAFVPTTGLTAGSIAEALNQGLCHDLLPPEALAALVDYASDGASAGTQLAQSQLATKLPGLVGLLLASPTFQLH